MSKKLKEKNKIVSSILEPETYQKLANLAKMQDRSICFIMRKILTQYFENAKSN